MRLYDRVLRNGFRRVGDDIPQEAIEIALAGLHEAQVVVADNVVDYFFREKTGGPWNIERDLPNVAPIAPNVFIEARRPVGAGRRIPSAWGVFLRSNDFLTGDGDKAEDQAQATDRAQALYQKVVSNALRRRWVGSHFKQMQDDVSRTRLADDVRWVSTGAIFWADTEEVPFGAAQIPWIFVRPDGGIARLPDGTHATLAVLDYAEAAPDEIEDASALFSELKCSLLLAVSLMHCKNVVLTEQAGRYRSRQERRAAERRHDPPLTRFYTLDIEPMKKVLREEGGSEAVGLKRAMHICRGHFAHYSEDKPLFGKYAGQFWIPAHVRGAAEAGLIGKDYNVKAPKPEAA